MDIGHDKYLGTVGYELDYVPNTSESTRLLFFRLFAARVTIELPSIEVTFECMAVAETEKVSIYVSCLLFSMSLSLLNLSHRLTNVNTTTSL